MCVQVCTTNNNNNMTVYKSPLLLHSKFETNINIFSELSDFYVNVKNLQEQFSTGSCLVKRSCYQKPLPGKRSRWESKQQRMQVRRHNNHAEGGGSTGENHSMRVEFVGDKTRVVYWIKRDRLVITSYMMSKGNSNKKKEWSGAWYIEKIIRND